MSNLDEMINRMVSACGVKNASQLAEVLDISPSAASQWKRREKIPEGIAARVARISGVSLEWIISGEGEKFPPEGRRLSPAGLDNDLLRQVIESVEIALAELEIVLKPNKKANLIVTLYAMAQESGKIDRTTLIRLVQLAA